jgi:hypothetical protein
MADDSSDRLQRYLSREGIATLERLGEGKDGAVWRTSRWSAVKTHERPESYRAERNAYIRLQQVGLTEIAGFAIPILCAYDDENLVIEMEIVTPPYVLDFASVRLDVPDDLIEDEGHTLADMIRDRFDERADEVIALCEELASAAGIYLTDVHRHNIKFAGE